jgi:hypothetical protein
VGDAGDGSEPRRRRATTTEHLEYAVPRSQGHGAADTTHARTLACAVPHMVDRCPSMDRDVACAQHGSGCCGRGITNLASPAACPVAGEPPATQQPSRVHVRSPLSISVSAAATMTVDSASSSAASQPHLLASTWLLVWASCGGEGTTTNTLLETGKKG